MNVTTATAAPTARTTIIATYDHKIGRWVLSAEGRHSSTLLVRVILRLGPNKVETHPNAPSTATIAYREGGYLSDVVKAAAGDLGLDDGDWRISYA